MNTLPKEIIFKVRTLFYQMQSSKKSELNKEFLSHILTPEDMGSTIVYRIDGMPLLIDDEDDNGDMWLDPLPSGRYG